MLTILLIVAFVLIVLALLGGGTYGYGPSGGFIALVIVIVLLVWLLGGASLTRNAASWGTSTPPSPSASWGT